jgi:hypothetical protein
MSIGDIHLNHTQTRAGAQPQPVTSALRQRVGMWNPVQRAGVVPVLRGDIGQKRSGMEDVRWCENGRSGVTDFTLNCGGLHVSQT